PGSCGSRPRRPQVSRVGVLSIDSVVSPAGAETVPGIAVRWGVPVLRVRRADERRFIVPRPAPKPTKVIFIYIFTYINNIIKQSLPLPHRGTHAGLHPLKLIPQHVKQT